MIRKFLFAVVIGIACASCGNDNSGETTNQATTETPSGSTNTTGGDTSTQQPAGSTTPATNAGATIAAADADRGLELIGKSDCLTCHKVEERLVGPGYREVANKYPVNDETINMLAQKIIEGGAGNWGQVPMTPHPQISKDDAATMAKYVMSLKQ